jgi:hypothetical protein
VELAGDFNGIAGQDQLRGLEERLVLGGPDLSVDVDGDFLAAQQSGYAIPDAGCAFVLVHRNAEGYHEWLSRGPGNPRGKPTAAVPAERRVLPMELQVGDRLADETGEYEVIGLTPKSQ